MVFNPNIPQASDPLSISQGDLLQNNTDLEAWSDVDHFPFSDAGSDLGKHDKVTLPERAAPTTGADELAMYSKDVAGSTELFVRKESNGVEIQMTSGTAPAGLIAYAQTNLAGVLQGTPLGIASVTVLTSSTFQFNFTTAQATSTYVVNATTVLSSVVTPSTAVVSQSPTSFVIKVSTGTASFINVMVAGG